MVSLTIEFKFNIKDVVFHKNVYTNVLPGRIVYNYNCGFKPGLDAGFFGDSRKKSTDLFHLALKIKASPSGTFFP